MRFLFLPLLLIILSGCAPKKLESTDNNISENIKDLKDSRSVSVPVNSKTPVVISAEVTDNSKLMQEKCQNFQIFDTTLYKNKPKEFEVPFVKLEVLYEQRFWNKDENRDILNENKIKRVVSSLAPSNLPYIIDIEHWYKGTYTEKSAITTINKFIQVAKIFKTLRPDLKIGFYGLSYDINNSWFWRSSKKGPYEDWPNAEKKLKELEKKIDVITTAIYLYAPDKVAFTNAVISQLGTYKSKPKYVFISPQYSYNAPEEYAGKYTTADFWTYQLNTVKKLADGVLIWSNFKKEWSDNLEWWEATKEFITDNELTHMEEIASQSTVNSDLLSLKKIGIDTYWENMKLKMTTSKNTGDYVYVYKDYPIEIGSTYDIKIITAARSEGLALTSEIKDTSWKNIKYPKKFESDGTVTFELTASQPVARILVGWRANKSGQSVFLEDVVITKK